METQILKFTISGNDVKDYAIVYPSVPVPERIDYSELAHEWQKMISDATGATLPVTDDTAPVTEKEILVGDTNREESRCVSPLYYGLAVSGSKLVASSGGVYSQKKLTELFKQTFIDEKTEIVLDGNTALEGNCLTEACLERTADTDVRIMSSNILAEFLRWNSTGDTLPIQPRLEILEGNLYTYRPDVVSVTEVTPNWAANLKYNLKNGYKLIVSEFDNGKVNFSAIIYNSETLTLNECGIDRYSENDNNTWCRNMGWATFTVKATGKEMAFVSTHWNVIYPQPLSQADEFDAKIMELSLGGTRPVMTGGDMNTRICFPNYNRLMSHGHVHNVKYISTGLRNHVGTMKDIWKPAKEGDPWRTLDHIFATKDVECTMFMTMLENAVIDMSDHNPIMADVKF